jgi:hypothetical protein
MGGGSAKMLRERSSLLRRQVFCPISGRKLVYGARCSAFLHNVSGTHVPHEDLIGHLTRTTALSRGEAERVVADVLGYFGEPVEAFVRRRHHELKAEGLTNDRAFARIRAELRLRMVAAPQFSLRQLRRIVYG